MPKGVVPVKERERPGSAAEVQERPVRLTEERFLLACIDLDTALGNGSMPPAERFKAVVGWRDAWALYRAGEGL